MILFLTSFFFNLNRHINTNNVLSPLKTSDIRAKMTCLALNDKIDENMNICTYDSTDGESNTDDGYTMRSMINCRPSDEDIEASRYWDYKMVPSIHKKSHGRGYVFNKEEQKMG